MNNCLRYKIVNVIMINSKVQKLEYNEAKVSKLLKKMSMNEQKDLYNATLNKNSAEAAEQQASHVEAILLNSLNAIQGTPKGVLNCNVY